MWLISNVLTDIFLNFKDMFYFFFVKKRNISEKNSETSEKISGISKIISGMSKKGDGLGGVLPIVYYFVIDFEQVGQIGFFAEFHGVERCRYVFLECCWV